MKELSKVTKIKRSRRIINVTNGGKETIKANYKRCAGRITPPKIELSVALCVHKTGPMRKTGAVQFLKPFVNSCLFLSKKNWHSEFTIPIKFIRNVDKERKSKKKNLGFVKLITEHYKIKCVSVIRKTRLVSLRHISPAILNK